MKRAADPESAAGGGRTPASNDAIRKALDNLPEWSVEDGRLKREYRFADFGRAIAFMAGAATFIEKMDHHPEWTNVYGTVRVTLWTHTTGGITGLDLRLAAKLEEFARNLL